MKKPTEVTTDAGAAHDIVTGEKTKDPRRSKKKKTRVYYAVVVNATIWSTSISSTAAEARGFLGDARLMSEAGSRVVLAKVTVEEIE